MAHKSGLQIIYKYFSSQIRVFFLSPCINLNIKYKIIYFVCQFSSGKMNAALKQCRQELWDLTV